MSKKTTEPTEEEIDAAYGRKALRLAHAEDDELLADAYVHLIRWLRPLLANGRLLAKEAKASKELDLTYARRNFQDRYLSVERFMPKETIDESGEQGSGRLPV